MIVFKDKGARLVAPPLAVPLVNPPPSSPSPDDMNALTNSNSKGAGGGGRRGRKRRTQFLARFNNSFAYGCQMAAKWPQNGRKMAAKWLQNSMNNSSVVNGANPLRPNSFRLATALHEMKGNETQNSKSESNQIRKFNSKCCIGNSRDISPENQLKIFLELRVERGGERVGGGGARKLN